MSVAPPTQQARKTYTVDEAATILGIGRTAAYAAIGRGEIRAVRVGRRLLVPRHVIDALVGGGAA